MKLRHRGGGTTVDGPDTRRQIAHLEVHEGELVLDALDDIGELLERVGGDGVQLGRWWRLR